MTAETQKQPWQAALPALYHRSATDADFRALCLKDARAALQQLGDFELPHDFKLRFADKIEEIVLPLPPANGQLALEELEAVAGGAVNVGTGYGNTNTIYMPYGYPPYGTPSVWPPVDPNTASGLPPLIRPGGPPPGY